MHKSPCVYVRTSNKVYPSTIKSWSETTKDRTLKVRTLRYCFTF